MVLKPSIPSVAWLQTVAIPLAKLLYDLLEDKYHYAAADWALLTGDELAQCIQWHFPLRAFEPSQVDAITRELHKIYVVQSGRQSQPLAIESL
jgi:hypothetical protein